MPSNISNLKSQISNLRLGISRSKTARQVAFQRRGLTLLELILALGLSIVLLFAIAMAMQIYWKAFDVKRANVEQAHLARALLRHMEDDIRSAVQYTPVDLSGLDSMTGGASSAASLASSVAAATGQSGAISTGTGTTGSSGSPSQGTQTGQQQPASSGGATQPTGQTGGTGSSSTFGTSGTGGTQSGSAQSGGTPSSGTASSGTPASGSQSTSGQQGTTDSAAATDTTEGVPAAVVGLYGSATQLQFDVSRLPRVDQYEAAGTANMVQIPSDIKTVTYYVRDEQSSGGAPQFGGGQFGSGQTASQTGGAGPSSSGQGRGLMRLEMDRAVSAYEESNGSLAAGYDGAKLLAEEVTSVQFRYWDGTAWIEDWNSDEMGGLPIAIEILITMDDPGAGQASAPQPFGDASGASAQETAAPPYRMVVHLPTASPQPPAEEPATDGTTADSATTSSTSTVSPSTSSGGTGSATTNSTKGATK